MATRPHSSVFLSALTALAVGIGLAMPQAWGDEITPNIPAQALPQSTDGNLSLPSSQAQLIQDQNIQDKIAHYQHKAHQKNLAKHTVWQRLFYVNNSDSRVAYDKFFLSKTGRHSLSDELDATIVALLTDTSENSPQCRFPARTEWLMNELGMDKGELAPADCTEFDTWYSQIKPHSMTLIFASDYMGNPGSMFGHTLLRIDPPATHGKNMDLVAYALNYAAMPPPNENSAVYAYKGLTGGYQGEYSLMRYFHKTKEYGDLESRDMWEYKLDLTPKEVSFLVKHIWEMKHVRFPYYFMDENCSYALMGLIDLVRPTLNLQDKFGWTVVPIETVKAVDKAGLIANTHYRPALETKLRHQEQIRGTHFGQQAQALTLPTTDPKEYLVGYDDATKAELLEMAYDSLYLQKANKKTDKAFVQSRLRELLVLRSTLTAPKNSPPPPTASDPRFGHGDKAWSVGMGVMQDKSATTLGYRTAYHGIADPQMGYATGQLLFLNGEVMVRDDKVRLNHLDILSVRAINPITTYKRPRSWGTDIAYKQVAVADGKFSTSHTHGVGAVSAQTGYAKAFLDNKAVCGAYLGAEVQVGKQLDKGVRAGVVPQAQCLWQYSDKVQGVVSATAPIWQNGNSVPRLDTSVQYNITPNRVMRLSMTHEQADGKDWQRLMVGYQGYF